MEFIWLLLLKIIYLRCVVGIDSQPCVCECVCVFSFYSLHAIRHESQICPFNIICTDICVFRKRVQWGFFMSMEVSEQG